jgi:DNA primase
VNISELKEEVSILDILELYGWEDDLGQRGWGEWQKTLCPFHFDHDPSGSVNVDKNLFQCFVCGDGRAHDILDIVMEQEFFDNVKDAKEWIEQRFL